jgi:TonB-linked SusC/RagA family outer membrane protein
MRAFTCVFLGVLFLALQPAEAAGQAGTLTGVVQDQQGGLPVPSVQVFIADLNLGGLTQQNGRFLLQNVPAGTHTVTAERLGYRSQTQTVNVAAGQTVTLNWTIIEQAIQLDEVIVTGTPGGTRRRAIGNAIATVDAAVITEQIAITNVQSLLTARTPGLQFARIGSQVGTGSNIRIRGSGSFSLSANPLVYVDGVRIANDMVGPGPRNGISESNPLDDFNPADIESIEIIKGPAAATLYGTEASAGVIQIITKRGRVGPAQFDASITQGLNFTRNPSRAVGTNVSCLTASVPLCPSRADLFNFNMYDEATQLIADGFFEWPRDNLYSSGLSQNYDLSVRGGTDAVRYFVSGNYANDEGMIWHNTNETFRFRANITSILSENMTLDVSSGYINGFYRAGEPLFGEGGIWRVTKLSWGRCLARLNLDSCTRRDGFSDYRPDDLAKVPVTREFERFTGSVTLNHTYGDWLTQRILVGLDRGFDINQQLWPRETVLVPTIGQTVLGTLDRRTPSTTNYSVDYAVNAAYQLNPTWRLTTSGGGQFYLDRKEETILEGREFPTGLSTTINQTASEQLEVGYAFVENRSLGFYVQEEVAWNDRVFITGAMRFDDNSAFGGGFDAQRYPKVSATWVTSEESFWNVDAINSLRLRGAWGKAGRQPDAFSRLNTYAVFRGTGGRSAIGPESPGNDDVGPEVSTEIELGFDMAVLDDRLSGEFTKFWQKNEDALLANQQPISTGFPGTVDTNIGRIDSWGWEASLSARLYQGGDVSFDLDLRGDHVMNEIKELGNFAGTTTIRVGMPFPNQTTDFKVVSADLIQPGQVTNVMCDSGVPLGPEDQTTRRAYELGGPIVPCSGVGDRDILVGPGFHVYTWTVAPTVNLFGNTLQIFAMAQGHYGRKSEDSLTEWVHFFNGTERVWLKDDPIYVAGCHRSCLYNDDTIDEIHDGAFWKLRELGLRYQLPQSMVARAGVERASLSFSGRNLFVLWRRVNRIAGVTVSDPEHGGNDESQSFSSNFHHGPPLSSASVMLRVTF